MFYYSGSINRLFLEVNISNTPSPGQPAEDAHNAVLNISIPPLLVYSGVRTKVVKHEVFKQVGNKKNDDVENNVDCIEVDSDAVTKQGLRLEGQPMLQYG